MLKSRIAIFAVVLAFCNGAPNVNDGSWRIVGGSEAALGASPSQIILRWGGAFQCSGCIITKWTTITAAHCVSGGRPSDFTITAGTNLLSSGGTTYAIKQVTVHPDFDYWNLINDVAILITEEEIQFSSLISPIALGTEEISGGVGVKLCGWGTTVLGGTAPEQLQTIDLITLTVLNCQEMWANGNVYASELCTLTNMGEGACHGDSGGPLIVDNKVVGLVSWGNPCANGMPDVFTRVSSFASWIQENTVE